jgi:uncharacterized protein (TIGR02145 family)
MHKINTKSNNKTMKMTRLAGYILLAVLATALWKCKDEDNGGDPVPEQENAARCQLEISGGQTEFDYGNTIALNGQLTQTSRFYNEMTLYVNNQKIYGTQKTSFSYNIYTVGLAAGNYTIKLTASDHRDSLYADTAQVTVNALLPTVETLEAMGIGTDTATIYGRYVSSGGLSTAWGLCYNTSGAPTKEENTFTTTDSTFSLALTGLEKTTTYYVRAWGTNSLGTGYGETMEFKTTDETGYFTDFRDDHQYRWVKIGDQVWMAENLAYLPFVSDPLNNPTVDSSIWVYGYTGMDVEGAKQTDNYKTYGALYSWKMANKYCPTGWHLPDTTAWNELISFLGGEEVAGGKMKERGTSHWYSPNDGATNESGFSALPAGAFWPGNGGGIDMHSLAVFWHAGSLALDSEYNTDYQLSKSRTKIALTGNHKKAAGFSVRCVKDQ